MKLTTDSPTAAGEWEVDFSIVQLLETSPKFREWFVTQITPSIEISKYIGGVIHTAYAGEGESDIEFGFVTESGDRHIVLIENKINAALQPDQVERYFKRAEFRVETGEWDSYTVCLLAPERYVSAGNTAEFDAVVHYEAVLDVLDDCPHDSAAFFQAVIDSTEQKSATTDASAILNSIGEQFRTLTHVSELYQSVQGYKKRIAFRSNHPDHPDALQYDVYIAKTGENGHSIVRVQLLDEDSLTDEKREAIESIVSQQSESLPDYEFKPGRKKNILQKKIPHRTANQDPKTESYPGTIAEDLQTLTDTFHPLFVSRSLR